SVTFLAPLDPLAWDRNLLRSLFGFDYLWEVYVPAVKRRWGYYVLPLLFGDRFVGRIEPRFDRSARAVRILRLWWEDGFDARAEEGFVPAFAEALEAYRAFHGATRATFPRDRAARALAGAVARAR
ncbi:MAG: crosslink repair DNA glycosylase YcaQ family protein, partial [Chloroflexota bacterium]